MQKVAVITGCSTGIGHEFALQMLDKGWRVVATARNPESLEILRKAGCTTHPLDVSRQEQIDETLSNIMAECGRIDLLINNAGYGLIAPAVEIPEEELFQQFQTNVFGLLAMVRKIAPLMKSQKEGKIINIGSISGIAATPFSAAYCASKAAVHALSDVLRMELKPFGIEVITVQPGGIMTDFGKNCEKSVSRILIPDSWYAPIERYVYLRANTSQEKATPVQIFVKKLIRKILQTHPPAVIRTGKRSFSLPLMKRILPEKILDRLMMKKYGLNLLSKS
jgi:short-subunit dehydrogenase